jgi:hypothetical protein
MRSVLLLSCSTMLMTSIVFCQHLSTGLDSLAWLAGCWEATAAGRIVSEQWMKPLGNMMMGMSRTVKNGRTIAYEQIRLVRSEDGLIRYVAHPSGQNETAFTLVHTGDRLAVFENFGHDFPTRIIYRRISSDSLLARIEGTVNGKPRTADFVYARADCD